MKIFSLQSKKSLVVWSVIFGTILNVLFFLPIGPVPYQEPAVDVFRNELRKGFPVKFPVKYKLVCPPDAFCLHSPAFYNKERLNPVHKESGFWVDEVFWIIVVFALLSLVRYYQYKNLKS